MKSKILNERVPTDYQNDYILRSKELEMDRIKNRIEILKVKRQKLYNQADSEFHGEYDNPEWGSKVHELNDRIRNNERRLSRISDEYATREKRLQAIDSSEYSSVPNLTHIDGTKLAIGIFMSAAILGLGYKIYKRKFSEAAKACSKKGLSYRQKSICMLKYQINAYEQQINFLNKAINKCSKDKNPDKCKKKIAQRIAYLTYKIQVNNQKLMHLEEKEKVKARESYEAELYITLLVESKRIVTEIDPIVTPIVLGSLAATGTGLTAAKIFMAKKKRKECVKYASQIEDPEERKKAYVRCYQAGTD